MSPNKKKKWKINPGHPPTYCPNCRKELTKTELGIPDYTSTTGAGTDHGVQFSVNCSGCGYCANIEDIRDCNSEYWIPNG